MNKIGAPLRYGEHPARHGGARAGSGRKPMAESEKKQSRTISFRLPVSLLSSVDNIVKMTHTESRTDFIVNILREAVKNAI